MWPDEPDTMHTWMVVPYDGSPPARATLRRAATAVSRAPTFYDGLLIATVGLERSALQGPVAEATEIAGPSLPIEIAWLSPADPIGAFRRFLAKTDVTLAVPLGGGGRAAWYVTACQASDTAARTMIFFLTPHELRAAAA